MNDEGPENPKLIVVPQLPGWSEDREMFYVLGGVDGRTPIPTRSVIAWGRMMEGTNRVVAQTPLPDYGLQVSTVFLGLDHGMWGRTLLFETMVFGPTGDEFDGIQERYSTWAEAEAGHADIVAQITQKKAANG